MRTHLLASFALALTVLAPLHGARADEGMWPFNMVPREKIQKDHGVTITDAWLDHVRLASVRFSSGGSGSFVSATGLALTNHHVASDCIAKLSRSGKDFLNDGYLAGTDGPEAKCPDLELNQLLSMEDVSDQVRAAKTADMSDADANTAQKGAMARIEKACSDKTGMRCDVVTLYAGGAYHLYTYKKYTDVRLVFAPEQSIAFFGGDPDNFTYPRYDFDLAIFRVYENDKPVAPKEYLRWSPTGPKDGDAVFTSGNPARTDRMDTMAELARLRDTVYPYYLDQLNRERGLLYDFAKGNLEQKRETRKPLFVTENSRKAITGMLGGLRSAALMKKKATDEAALRKALDADPSLKAKYAGVFADIEKAEKTLGDLYKRYAALERGASRSSLFHTARALVRLPRELQTPNDRRLREYRDSNLDSLKLELFSPAPVYAGVEVMMWQAWLERMVRDLGPADPLVKQLLGGKTPARAAAELISGSKLTDVYARRALFDGGQSQVNDSKDAAVAFVRAIDDEARAIRKRYEDEIEGPMRQLGEKVAQATFAVRGTSVYPDATYTLRLSPGVVKGYTEHGKAVPPTTDFAGMYKHATGTEPFKLPQRWLDKKGVLKQDVPLDFVSTNDIIGGNSGSPVVNGAGDLVGLIFDGNLSSLPNAFVYDETTARAVSVDTAAILEALPKVFGATALAAELTGGAASGQ